MYVLTPPEQDATDNQWYHQLKSLMLLVGETFEALMPPLDRLNEDYERFLQSEHLAVPNLYPVVADEEALHQTRQKLEALRSQIQREEQNKHIAKAYTARITEILTNIDMIIAAGSRDDREFAQLNQELYGTPSKKIFAAACTWVKGEARRVAENQPALAGICEEVLAAVPDINGDTALLFPSDETFQKVKTLHMAPGAYLEQLFRNTTDQLDGIITPESGDTITRVAIGNVGSDFEVADSEVGLWAVLQSRGQVVRPVDYALPPAAFLGIVAHEVGSHLLESTNGGRSRLRLLKLGMDGYEKGNEGRAFLREQIMYSDIQEYVHQESWYPTKASWEYRIAIHIVISLAVGLHKKPYAFTELYKLVCTLFEFWTASRGLEVVQEQISQGAWSLVVRALKGTSGQAGAYYKDIVYLEGNSSCWQAAKTRPELILYGDFGKFDITNQEHVMMLEELGIIPLT